MAEATSGGRDWRDRDPAWWRQAAVYQIYPRSFSDSNGDGIGDLRGAVERLDYLAELGVDAIWLSPFYPSPLVDGGYDVADYRDVEPHLGTLADFTDLVDGAHRRGIGVIVDIVPNHSSSEHPWFREALASAPGSAARARYIFRDGSGPNGNLPPSDWASHFGGSAWTRVPDGQWYLHLFAPQQPDFDWSNREVREDFLRTLRFWGDRGVDGFRVDVAHALAKDLSEPFRSQPNHDRNLPIDGSDPLYDRAELDEIYGEWRAVFNEYSPPLMAVAEATVRTERRARYARSSSLGQAFNFDLTHATWSAQKFRDIVSRSLATAADSESTTTWVLSNHDIVRHASRYGLPGTANYSHWLMTDGTRPPADEAGGLRRARAATLLMLALPGSAYLYQGEELGLLEVADLPAAVLQDPVWEQSNHRVKGRDGCRVPLPWTRAGRAFGFSDGRPWLPQPPWFRRFSVEAEERDAASTLHLYRDALALRRELAADETLTMIREPRCVHFVRSNGWGSLTNFGPKPAAIPDGARVVLASVAEPIGTSVPPDATVWYRL